MQLELDYYEARNLLELLRATESTGPVPMDTGDWHAQVSWKLKNVLPSEPRAGMREGPNADFQEMRTRALQAAIYRALGSMTK